MAHAERCPVCGGEGKVKPSGLDKVGDKPRPCHGCKGLGWVPVDDTPCPAAIGKVFNPCDYGRPERPEPWPEEHPTPRKKGN